MSKKCTKCAIEKLMDQFSNDKSKSDKKSNVCKECAKKNRKNVRLRGRNKASQFSVISGYNFNECMCKEIIEEIFPGHVFSKIRLPEFKNPETGSPLELDLYNIDLKLAIEYQGEQHYIKSKLFHKKEGAFEKQKVRDLVKENYCQINKIMLIEIPNLQYYDEIKEYIGKCCECVEKKKCKKPNNEIKTYNRKVKKLSVYISRKFPIPDGKLNNREIVFYRENLREMTKKAHEKLDKLNAISSDILDEKADSWVNI